MYKHLITLSFAASLGLVGCQQLPADQQRAISTGAGAVTGLALADLLGANTNWKIVATLAGAAAGNLIAKNNETQECAYSNGNGGYYTAPC